MKYARILLLLAAALLGATASAAEPAKAEAEKLLDSMNLRVAFDQAIAASLEIQLKSHPEMVPYKAVMQAFFTKYASYDALKPAMVEIYASEFTAAELAELGAFYATPTGRKSLERLPVLMEKSAEMSRQVVQEHMAELKQMIDAETKRIESQTPASAAPAAPEDPKADGAPPA